MRLTGQRLLIFLVIGACLWLGTSLGSFHICEAQAPSASGPLGLLALERPDSFGQPLCVACVWSHSSTGLTEAVLLPTPGMAINVICQPISDYIAPFLSSSDSRAPPAA